MPKISTIDPATTNMRIMSQSDFCGNGPDGKADFTRQSFPTSTVGYLEDQWNTVVVKVRFNFTTGGEIKIWMNGDLAFEDNDVVGYNDAKGPYFKIGVYATTKPVTAFYDEIRVGDANSSYDEVCPKGPKTISLNAPLLKIVN
jgi:hypothetical protein